MKRIVITGASGFVGRHTIAPLLARGFDVHVLSRQPYDAGDNTAVHVCDILDKTTDFTALLSAIKPTHILHLSWCVEPGKFWHSPQNHDWVAASLKLYDAFVNAGGRRFIGAGTCAEYDWSNLNADTVLHEDTSPCAPATLYGQSKLKLYETLKTNATRDGISMAWGRIFFVYGAGEKQGRLISDAIVSLLRGQNFDTTAGTQIRDFMHVSDLGAAFAALCDSNVNGAVNMAAGKARRLADILRDIETITSAKGLLNLGARPMPPHEPPAIVADTSRLNTAVGFTPAHDYMTRLKQTVSWWRDTL